MALITDTHPKAWEVVALEKHFPAYPDRQIDVVGHLRLNPWAMDGSTLTRQGALGIEENTSLKYLANQIH